MIFVRSFLPELPTASRPLDRHCSGRLVFVDCCICSIRCIGHNRELTLRSFFEKCLRWVTLSASSFQSRWCSVFSPSAVWPKLKQPSTRDTILSTKRPHTGRCSVLGCVPPARCSIPQLFCFRMNGAPSPLSRIHILLAFTQSPRRLLQAELHHICRHKGCWPP